MPESTAPLAFAGEKYVSLTTYRKSGEAVSTAVWVAGHHDGLVVITSADAGKVKRLRNNARVELRPCTMTGSVAADAPVVVAVAEVVTDSDRLLAMIVPLRAKYGLQFRMLMGGPGKSVEGRAVLRITSA